MAADYNDDFDAYAAKSFLELAGDSFWENYNYGDKHEKDNDFRNTKPYVCAYECNGFG